MTQQDATGRDTKLSLAGERVALVSRFSGMPRRDARVHIRRAGGHVAEVSDDQVTLVVIGEANWPLPDGGCQALFDEPTRQAIEAGRARVITETELWRRLGLVDGDHHVRNLYTPAMLADMLDVPVAIIRRWQRRRLIVPVRTVGRLPYFDFQQVAAARRLAALLASGMSPQAIEKQLAALARHVPQAQTSLAQLAVIVEGHRLLLRKGQGLVEAGGQLQLNFDGVADEASSDPADEAGQADPSIASDILSLPAAAPVPPEQADAASLLAMAADAEDEGRLGAAVELYRAAVVAEGADAEVSFRIAELLYRLDDLCGARERYYMAIELDPNYVEARANLGCVLAELGQLDLAAAAFQGALNYHGDYPDAHYHLARTLDELGRPAEAQQHWRTFLQLASDSPWAAEARSRLGVVLSVTDLD